MLRNPHTLAQKLLRTQEEQDRHESSLEWQGFATMPQAMQMGLFAQHTWLRFRRGYYETRLRNTLIDYPAILGPAETIHERDMSELARAVVELYDLSDERVEVATRYWKL